MKGKIILFDVGNTLIYTKRGLSISPVVLDCLAKLREKGYILGLSTLRTKDMLMPILDQFKFDCMVLANGALVYIDDELVYSKAIEANTLTDLKNLANINNISIVEYRKDNICYALEFKSAKDIINIDNSLNSYVWEVSGDIDITANGVNKVKGLDIILKHYGYKSDDVIFFGDGFNDIEMMEYSGFGIAMGESPECIFKLADYITKTAKEDGIFFACKELGLI